MIMENIQKNRILNIIFQKILPIVLILVFVVRLFSYTPVIVNYVGLDSSPFSNIKTAVSLITIWLNYTAIIIVIISLFIKQIKFLRNIVKFILPLCFILTLCLVKPISILLAGSQKYQLVLILLTIEASLGLIACLYTWLCDYSIKLKIIDILKILGIFLLLLIPSLPTYFFQFMFGYANPTIRVIDISSQHRLFLYLAFIIPVVMYFTLRNKDPQIIRFVLIYISVATMIGFIVAYDYHTFFEPWAWPFHLCNTAMFIVPLCLIFKLKKLFYFTYFINVMGAFLAMLMPNYPEATNLFSIRMFRFWYNHWIAFFMPLLCIALKQFKRPTLKEFYYSMFFFFFYFLIALVFNVYFTAIGKDVDYFFINSDYVADKLGKWAEDIYNISTTVKIKDLELVFHPIYQILFFVVYIGIAFGIWFVYTEFYRIADDHYELHLKLHDIKIHKYAVLAQTSKEYPDMLEAQAKLELKHLSKKYGTSSVYAVQDASFEVNSGEIFGFLGPNGAGKSTIIKSIVGILPVSEGSIEVCGYDVSVYPVQAKSCIGYVPDHYALYEKLTGREYINYIADIYDVSLEERNERLTKYIKLFELENSIDSKIKTYSHGMKQKITIMAALIHNPKVWILDEPLTGLDPTSIFQVKECMKQHASAGNIVFFSSHIIDIVEKLCERVAVIKKGEIKEVKTIAQIEKEYQTLEEFYLTIIRDDTK